MEDKQKKLLERITLKPGLLGGKPTIRGMRFPVGDIKIGNCDNRAMWDFLRSSIQQALAMLATDEIDIVDLE